MNPGKLRERITFERRSTGRNEFGEAQDSWRPLFSVWAAVEPISGREFFAALQTQSDVTIRVTCRYSKAVAEVTERDRIKHDGKVYDIRHPPIDRESRHREVQFMCTQHVGE